MRRREVLALAAGCLIGAPHVRAQEASKLPIIGVLTFARGPERGRFHTILQNELEIYGWVTGRTMRIEQRFAELQASRLPSLASELAALNPSVLFGASSTEVAALLQATTTIPIVFATHSDPVAFGHVASLARPGRNATGVSMLLGELLSKQLGLLKEALPSARRIGVLWNPTTASHAPALPILEAAAAMLQIEPVFASAATDAELGAAFAALPPGLDALLVIASSLVTTERTRIADLARDRKLPTVFGFKENVSAGGLMSYGGVQAEAFRRAAWYIDRILRGARPADLPVEQPATFELALNLRTAEALGVDFPASLMARADEVIE
jgi:putative ABC transport system substrate-binding protein